VYLESSALAKLVLPEPESGALADFLRDWPARTASVIARVELRRAVRREVRPRDVSSRAAAVLEDIALLPLDDETVERACALEPSALRTLDAIHLATALSIREALGGMVTYDRRLADAARRAGLTVWSPR
jgi:predicted nucleic acid-binding protein